MLRHFSHVRLFATPWTVACQAPLSMGFSRQECWGGLPCPPPGDLPDPGIEPVSPIAPALQADSLLLSHRGSPRGALSDKKALSHPEARPSSSQPHRHDLPPSLARSGKFPMPVEPVCPPIDSPPLPVPSTQEEGVRKAET